MQVTDVAQTTAAVRAADVPLPPDPAAASGRLVVGIAAHVRCSVSIDVDGVRVLDRELKAGESYEFEVGSDFVLTASDAAAVTMTLNGADAKPLGEQGRSVTARLNPDNFRNYLAAP